MMNGKIHQQDPAFITSDNHTFNEKNIVESPAIEQITLLQRANSRAKAALSDAHTASYAGHTQASIARLTDKVELARQDRLRRD
jgi:hypothetical protein